MGNVVKKYTEEDMIKMDCEGKNISFSNKKLFYDVFSKSKDVLKLFILSQLELEVDENDCVIRIDDELGSYDNVDDRLEICVYVNNLGVKLFVKRNSLKNGLELCDYMLVLVNLNIKDRLTFGGKKIENGFEKVVMSEDMKKGIINRYALVIYPEYYRDLYFNKRIDLFEKDLWFVLFSCRSFQELYNVSYELLLDEEIHNGFISCVVDTIKDINDENEKRERDKRNEFEKNIFEKEINEYYSGMRKGMDRTINKCIVNMIKENLDNELISRVTGKDVDYIDLFKKM